MNLIISDLMVYDVIIIGMVRDENIRKLVSPKFYKSNFLWTYSEIFCCLQQTSGSFSSKYRLFIRWTDKSSFRNCFPELSFLEKCDSCAGKKLMWPLIWKKTRKNRENSYHVLGRAQNFIVIF